MKLSPFAAWSHEDESRTRKRDVDGAINGREDFYEIFQQKQVASVQGALGGWHTKNFAHGHAEMFPTPSATF